MAKLIVSLFFLFATAGSVTAGGHHKFLQNEKPAPMPQPQMLSHFRFYYHDIGTGRNPTVISVASAPTTNASATSFGLVNIIDDPLTEGPELSSKLVGRAQGLFAFAAQDAIGLMMAMNFVFVEGKYNGSSIAILGRNKVLSDTREMPVVGGSGLFRLARGYALAHTHTFDVKAGIVIVQYNVFVWHF